MCFSIFREHKSDIMSRLRPFHCIDSILTWVHLTQLQHFKLHLNKLTQLSFNILTHGFSIKYRMVKSKLFEVWNALGKNFAQIVRYVWHMNPCPPTNYLVNSSTVSTSFPIIYTFTSIHLGFEQDLKWL